MSTIQAIMADPTRSYWLKQAIRDSLERDYLDALYDAEALVAVMRVKADEALGRTTPAPIPNAPELLAALQALVLWESGDTFATPLSESQRRGLWSEARAAIANATGGQS